MPDISSATPLRRALLTAAAAIVLLVGLVLAFYSGGYFDEQRDLAGVAVWVAVALAGLAGATLRRSRGGWLALGGLLGLAGWTLLSLLWAPVAGDAYHAGQLIVLYLGVLVAASMVLDVRRAALAEVVLAASAAIVVTYALGDRLLPGLLHYQGNPSADGRLSQPLTYWNSLGEMAAIGVVLCARLAGDAERPRWLRMAATVASAPLGMGLYLTFSRGALYACAAGLLMLVAVVHRREQLSAVIRVAITAVLAGLAASPFASITVQTGSLGSRERDGLIALALLLVIGAVSAAAHLWVTRRERPGPITRLGARPSLIIAMAAILTGLAVFIIAGAGEGLGSQLGGGAGRLTSLKSNRYDYWAVALRAFSHSPLHGVGAGGWRVWWLRYRTVNEGVTDAHSLPLQTMAELGLVGIALLAAFVAGLGLSAARALRSSPQTAGAVAGLVAYFVHAPLDWDWQMPAVTLPAMVLAGIVINRSGASRQTATVRQQE